MNRRTTTLPDVWLECRANLPFSSVSLVGHIRYHFPASGWAATSAYNYDRSSFLVMDGQQYFPASASAPEYTYFSSHSFFPVINADTSQRLALLQHPINLLVAYLSWLQTYKDHSGPLAQSQHPIIFLVSHRSWS